MEGARFLLAIVLSIAVVLLVNLMFPPGAPRETDAPADSLVVDTVLVRPEAEAAEDTPRLAPAPQRDTAAPPAELPTGAPEETAARADTFWVQTEMARYGFSSRGGAIVSVELLAFESYTRPGPVQLVEPDDPALLEYGLRVGNRVVPLSTLSFDSPIPAGDTLLVDEPTSVSFRSTSNGATIEMVYGFAPDRYVVPLEGHIRGVGEDPTLLLDLGPRLAVNEADSAEDLRALAYVVRSRRTGLESVRIEDVEQQRIEEGPLSWVALKNKYFLAAAIQAEEGEAGSAFGGLIAEPGQVGAERVRATLPVDRSGDVHLRLFFGPQEYGRLAAIGDGLKDVNPYGWRIFQPIIRPLADIITWILTALHNVLGLGYGWVLILFGFAMRGILWPLNAKAMRSQLKTMELQPRIKEIQEKYKEKPEQLQKEMMRLYKEEGFNPLGGCLPMLIPWPVLITLFFVFQNTIEFRGVEFLWLPDLSRPDPFYLLPIILGLSLFALQYMSVRATGSDNPQQKMLMWIMPIMMTVIFLNFASGLNLYYAASNVASLPQQIQIIGERKRAKARIDAKQEKEKKEAKKVAKKKG
ncbi:MAG: membrane protein insertase YidC [Gemmatimonadota bacterium]